MLRQWWGRRRRRRSLHVVLALSGTPSPFSLGLLGPPLSEEDLGAVLAVPVAFRNGRQRGLQAVRVVGQVAAVAEQQDVLELATPALLTEHRPECRLGIVGDVLGIEVLGVGVRHDDPASFLAEASTTQAAGAAADTGDDVVEGDPVHRAHIGGDRPVVDALQAESV